MFLVRVLFCLFAEDTGVFGRDGFTDFITYRTQEDGSDLGPRLEQFFRVLDTPKDRRQRHTDELLAGLEYVNGALFTGHLAFAAPARSGGGRRNWRLSITSWRR